MELVLTDESMLQSSPLTAILFVRVHRRNRLSGAWSRSWMTCFNHKLKLMNTCLLIHVVRIHRSTAATVLCALSTDIYHTTVDSAHLFAVRCVAHTVLYTSDNRGGNAVYAASAQIRLQ